ncbi:MAG: hypothetical protein KatS3mg009_1597 [Acidimicrobiia bacterium]|nr:MAG: hypothetical protein KatS3mg009_1597 [Acidimicrobiia bacterium]
MVTLHAAGIAWQHRPMTSRLEDGRYDAFVVWAERRGDAIALECAITTGEHRGDVVDIVSRTMRVADELSLVGMPCTLVVRGDAIRVELA